MSDTARKSEAVKMTLRGDRYPKLAKMISARGST
jgi:hypothetical protein